MIIMTVEPMYLKYHMPWYINYCSFIASSVQPITNLEKQLCNQSSQYTENFPLCKEAIMCNH